MIFNNKEVREMASLIIENHLDFKKGNVGGYSIEIVESDPESHTSYTTKTKKQEILISIY